MPGGRFQIKPDGTLDTPTRQLPVADTFRGKDKSVLENNVMSHLPSPSQYLEGAVQTDLIVEGTVSQLQETRMDLTEVTPEQLAQAKAQGQLPDLVYTFYSFTVNNVLLDKSALYKDDPRIPSQLKRPPINAGNVITVLEMGGTYQGITQRRSWAQFLKSGDKLLLFLRARACGDDRLPLCNQSERETNRILYLVDDNTSRFLIGSDNHIIALTHNFFSQLYNGQGRARLEQDILGERTKMEKALEEQRKQPTPTPGSQWLWPTPTPKP